MGFFDEMTASSLNGDRTVTVRPFAYEDAVALERLREKVPVFVAERDTGTLTAGMAKVTRSSPTYPVDVLRARVRRDAEPLGLMVGLDVETAFGSIVEGSVFTTGEAERTQHVQEAAEGTHRAAPRPLFSTRLFVPDPDGQEMALTPVFGTSATARVSIRGLAPAEVEDRVLEALRAEFGEAFDVASIAVTAVADRRVDVFESESGRVVGVNVLEAEAHLAATGVPFRTVASDPGLRVGR